MRSLWGCLASSASPRHLLASSLSFLSRTSHAHDHVPSVVQIHGYSSNTSSRTSVDRRHQWPSVSIRSPWTRARTPQSSLLRLTTKRLTAPLVVAAALAAAVAVAAGCDCVWLLATWPAAGEIKLFLTESWNDVWLGVDAFLSVPQCCLWRPPLRV